MDSNQQGVPSDMTPSTQPQLTYSDLVQWIESQGIMPDRAPSLERMRSALDQIQDKLTLHPAHTIVVAGTNGKGSVCAMLEALLMDAGQSVGLYTSPHLEETTERFRKNGQDSSEEVFCLAFAAVEQTIQTLRLSHFEILTLMAVWMFFSPPSPYFSKWVILEVGLGGTWDATNAIAHDFNVITSLGLDHQNLLGQSLIEIARNKFGIIHHHTQVIHAPFSEEVQPLAKEVQKKTKSHWTCAQDFSWSVGEPGETAKTRTPLYLSTSVLEPPLLKQRLRNPQFWIHTRWGNAPLALPGFRAAQNAAIALTVFERLGFNPEPHLGALSEVRWGARMERLDLKHAPCPLYLSGDHNDAGVKSLRDLLGFYQRKRLWILCGVGKEKNLDPMMEILFSIADAKVFLTETPFRGRASLKEYGKWADLAEGFEPDPTIALQNIFSLAQKEDLILVTGSLYLAGAVRKLLKQ